MSKLTVLPQRLYVSVIFDFDLLGRRAETVVTPTMRVKAIAIEVVSDLSLDSMPHVDFCEV